MTQGRNFKRHMTSLTRNDEGYSINPPKHRGLVLSGGGAKGIAYLGLIKALHERGRLKDLTHVSGASAGAMTASLLAVGMNLQNIEKLVHNLDLTKLLDNSGIGIRARGHRFRNVLDLVYMVQFKEHLANLEKPIPPEQEKNFTQLNQKIALYQQALAKQGIKINTVDDIVKMSQIQKNLVKIDKAFKSLPKQLQGINGEELENPQITLGDLGVLRSLLPEDKKHLIKNLNVVVTNQTKNELERYSENATPNQSIAQVVQWSGAHPALFVPGKNAKGEYVADGGILDNMPEIEGLNREEVLCAKAETGSAYQARVDKAKESAPDRLSSFKTMMDSIVQIAIGGKWLEGVSSVLNREKVFHYIDNMIYINTGSVTTTNMAPTKEQKEEAIENGYKQTIELLDSQTKTLSHPLLAVLYVGINKLDQTLLDDRSEPELFKAAGLAKMITLIQADMVNQMNLGDYTHIKECLDDIEDILTIDAGMSPKQKEKAFALCVKQINHLSEGKLQEHLTEIAVNEATKTAAEELGFVWKVLKALWTPIEWILSQFNTPAPEVEIKIKPGAVVTAQQNVVADFKDRFLAMKNNLSESNNKPKEQEPELNTEPSGPRL